MLFLSTPSARRATPTAHTRWFLCINFYPRPPRGGRPQNTQSAVDTKQFLSTPSARRATKTVADRHKALEISIHALREEGDAAYLLRLAESRYFYPRPPRGGRRSRQAVRATVPAISIHALREEGDSMSSFGLPLIALFLSTPSARRATDTAAASSRPLSDFYPRPPRGGRPRKLASMLWQRVFLSTPSARRATRRMPLSGRPYRYFYPRPPRGGRPCAQALS